MPSSRAKAARSVFRSPMRIQAAQERRLLAPTPIIGRFVTLVPDKLVVEIDEFETEDPALRGEMISTIRLSDADGGTDLEATHDELPPGVSPADNELGWRLALAKLAKLVEGG